MRELKFRAWDGKKMWQVDELQLNNDGSVEVCCWLDEGEDNDSVLTKIGCNHEHCNLQEIIYPRLWVMQYTGLKDNKGIEGYHKDVCTDGQARYLIEWDEAKASFYLKPINHKGCRLTMNMLSVYWIIGDIHENPELLEKP